jgi:uroporphyrinogen-III decarboxylase
VELSDAFHRVGTRGFIKGNIDSVTVLLQGTKDAIRDDVTNRIRTGKQYPGFILSTACSIAPRVERERIQMLRSLVEQYG